jgi:uncharacterized surface anchored protein
MCTTDANGDCTISNVEAPGNYCIVETNLPDGYSADSDLPECFSVVLDQTKVLSYVNPRATGAIKITKTRKHAADGSGDHAHAGVTFTITGGSLDDPGMDVLTDSNGEACLDGLVLSEFVGDYTVTETLPDGYVADGPLSKDVSVTTATTCGTGLEDTVSFSNTPLTDFTVSVNSQVDGGTHSTITCTGGPGNINETDGGTPSLDDPSLTVLSLPPGLYTCVIDIDP